MMVYIPMHLSGCAVSTQAGLPGCEFEPAACWRLGIARCARHLQRRGVAAKVWQLTDGRGGHPKLQPRRPDLCTATRSAVNQELCMSQCYRAASQTDTARQLEFAWTPEADSQARGVRGRGCRRMAPAASHAGRPATARPLPAPPGAAAKSLPLSATTRQYS